MNDAPLAVWLYGSHARGDVDAYSDRDVLVVGPASSWDQVADFDGLGANVSVSRYDWSEIEAMAEYGSLFLHHLRLEGSCLFEVPSTSGRLGHLLQNLGPYRRSRRDLRAFQLALDDVRRAPRRLTTQLFEMAVLATILRHSSVLGCYVTGAPRFGRTDAFRSLSERWSIPPEVVDDFIDLYRFRLHEEGRDELPYQPTWKHVDDWTDFAERHLDRLEEEIDEYESRLLASHRNGEGSWP